MNLDLYDQDFYAWALECAKLLREGRLDDIQIDFLVEEIEGLAWSEKRLFINRMAKLFAYLLTWQFDPEVRSKIAWEMSIHNYRDDLRMILEDSPSLRLESDYLIKRAHRRAKYLANVLSLFKLDIVWPKECPFTFDEILDEEFMPS